MCSSKQWCETTFRRSQVSREQIRAVSVVIPVYNEGDAVGMTVQDVANVLSQSAELDNWEIVVVDDGSTDGCSEGQELETSKCQNGELRLLFHLKNRGYGAALKTGIRAARFETIVIIDADGTYPSSAIPRLIEALHSAEMAVGSRTGANVHYSFVRKLPKFFLKLFSQWIAGEKIPDLNSGLRDFRKSDMSSYERLLPNGFSFTTTLTLAMLTQGWQVHFEPIDYALRIGCSKFRPLRDTSNFCVTVLRLGVLFAPLKIFLPVAAVCFGAGLFTLLGDVFIRQDITNRTVILLMASLQIGMFALLAEMISRK